MERCLYCGSSFDDTHLPGCRLESAAQAIRGTIICQLFTGYQKTWEKIPQRQREAYRREAGAALAAAGVKSDIKNA
jgi:hypothetical protein